MPTIIPALDGSVSQNGEQILFVCLLGIGVVFVGLICIVLICKLSSYLIRRRERGDMDEYDAPLLETYGNNDVSADKRDEFVAVISAAIAEDLGTDIDAFKIKSITKLD